MLLLEFSLGESSKSVSTLFLWEDKVIQLWQGDADLFFWLLTYNLGHNGTASIPRVKTIRSFTLQRGFEMQHTYEKI